MNKKLKAIYKQSKDYVDGTPFDRIYIINTHRLYDGFWGENGYNCIKVLVSFSKDKEEVFYVFNKNYQTDVLQMFDEFKFNIDIPNDLDCIRLFTATPLVAKTGCSSTTIERLKK